MIYADNAATSSMCQDAKDAMLKGMELFGNPSSTHAAGRAARKAIEEARRIIADCIGGDPEGIYFTSGGTESDNIVATQPYKIITSDIEHAALYKNPNVHPVIPTDGEGIVGRNAVYAATFTQPIIISVMAVNNEVGTIQPIGEITKMLRTTNPNIIFHTDAVQALGHIPVNAKEMKFDMLSGSAHKFRGPKGIGILYCDPLYNQPPMQLMYGGDQERKVRPGTENVPAIMAMAAALRQQCETMGKRKLAVTTMRDELAYRLLKISDSHINGSMVNRVAGNLNIRFDGVDAETLVALLDSKGICVSAGAACHSGSVEPSHVLKNMGLTDAQAKSAIRISLNEENTMDEIAIIAKGIANAVDTLRTQSIKPAFI